MPVSCGSEHEVCTCTRHSDENVRQYRETNLDVSPVFDQVLRLDGTKEPGDLMAEIKQFLKPDCD
jgi:hypothetical protein